jgi:hypothetical protein
MIDQVKKYRWVVFVLIPGLAFLSTKGIAMWYAPEEAEKANKAVASLAQQLEVSAAKQDVREEKQDYLIELLTDNVIGALRVRRTEP